jgi:predicted transcriptional regulator
MDSNLLLAAVRKSGMTMHDFLDIINMPSSTWSKKIRGLTEFNRAEIQAIVSCLGLSEQDTFTIFF